MAAEKATFISESAEIAFLKTGEEHPAAVLQLLLKQ